MFSKVRTVFPCSRRAQDGRVQIREPVPYGARHRRRGLQAHGEVGQTALDVQTRDVQSIRIRIRG